jgi:hypothetical protein
MKTLTGLEKRIDKHMKESADQFKLFKCELQSLKPLSRTKASRPSSEAVKTKSAPGKKPEPTTRTVKTDDKKLDCWLSPMISKRLVNFSLRVGKRSVLIISPRSECATSSE